MAFIFFLFKLYSVYMNWHIYIYFFLFKKKDSAICKTNKKASLYTGLSLHQSVEASCGGACGSRVTNEQQGGQGGREEKTSASKPW